MDSRLGRSSETKWGWACPEVFEEGNILAYIISGEDVKINRGLDLREAQEAYVEAELEVFISEICPRFGWDPLLDYNRKDVADMLKKALG
jgi:hypothetical protein